MEKEFIPYKQALALKELGFDELCICMYNREKALRVNVFNNPNDRFKSVQLSYNNGKIPAPLYQQCFRWFREKYELDSWVYKSRDYAYFYSIFKDSRYLSPSIEFTSYEEAELECLKKLIEIVKNNRNQNEKNTI